MSFQIRKTQQVPSSVNENRTTPVHFIGKFKGGGDKEEKGFFSPPRCKGKTGHIRRIRVLSGFGLFNSNVGNRKTRKVASKFEGKIISSQEFETWLTYQGHVRITTFSDMQNLKKMMIAEPTE